MYLGHVNEAGQNQPLAQCTEEYRDCPLLQDWAPMQPERCLGLPTNQACQDGARVLQRRLTRSQENMSSLGLTSSSLREDPSTITPGFQVLEDKRKRQCKSGQADRQNQRYNIVA